MQDELFLKAQQIITTGVSVCGISIIVLFASEFCRTYLNKKLSGKYKLSENQSDKIISVLQNVLLLSIVCVMVKTVHSVAVTFS